MKMQRLVSIMCNEPGLRRPTERERRLRKV